MQTQDSLKELHGLISSREAGKKFGLSNDYISRLCRFGKVKGVLLGKVWFVHEESLEQFVATTDARRAENARQLSEQRRGEYQDAQATPYRMPASAASGASAPLAAPLAVGLASIVLVGTLYVMPVSAKEQLSSLAAVFQGVPSRFFSQSSTFESGVFSRAFSNIFGDGTPTDTGTGAPGESGMTGTGTGIFTSTSGTAQESVGAAPATTTIVYNTYPVIERTVERTVTESGLSQDDLTAQLQSLKNTIMSQVYRVPSAGEPASVSIAAAQRITNLSGVTISNVSVNGITGLTADEIPALAYLSSSGGALSGAITSSSTATSTFDGGMQVAALNVTGSATSTFAGGISISDGCFAVDGVCISGSGSAYTFTYPLQASGNVVSLAFGTTTANTWSALQQFANATSSIFSAYSAYFGDTSTTTISSTGSITLPSAALLTAPYASSTALSVSGTGYFATASTTNLTISSLGVSAGQCLTVDPSGVVSTTACGSGSGTFSWTPTTNYGTAVNATSTPLWMQNGLMASSTSQIAYASTTMVTAATASTTDLIVSNSFTLAGLSGFLKATAGVVATAAINLASDITGVLATANGGTGWAAVQSGSLLYGNGTSALATTTAGTDGYVLALSSGTPTWVASTTLSTITGTLSIAKGGTNATSFTTSGNAVYYDGTSLVTAPTTGAVTTPFASTTAISATQSSFFATASGGVGIGTSTTSGFTLAVNGVSQFERSGKAMFINPNYSAGNSFAHIGTSLGSDMDLRFGTNESPTQLVLATSSYVGIGTTTPGSLFGIDGVANFVASATSTIYNGLRLTGNLDVAGTATSTFTNGINLAGGCFAVNGVCVGGGSSQWTTTGSDIYYSNKVGIASTSPFYDLSIGTGATSFSVNATNGYATTTQIAVTGTATSTFAGPIASASGNLIVAAAGTTNNLLLNPYGGNVGVGTSTPTSALSVQQTIAAPQFMVSYSDTRYATMQVTSAGDLVIDSSSGTVSLLDNNFYVCSGGSCPSMSALGVTMTGNGNFELQNNMYFGNGFYIGATTSIAGTPTTTVLSIYDTTNSEVMRIDQY